jgi:hypothetical protein
MKFITDKDLSEIEFDVNLLALIKLITIEKISYRMINIKHPNLPLIYNNRIF